VTNLGAVVDAWIKVSKASQTDLGEEPLEHISLHNGSKLLWDSPPAKFFTEVVNDPKAVLGRGAFSVVYKATRNGRSVAVKRLTKAAAADPGFAEEIRVLARVPPHPNIIQLLGVYLTETECLIISELGGPTLFSALSNESSMPWMDRLRILSGIADALRHLHGLDPSILHMDLKASNILLVGEERISKLCDFGLALEWKVRYVFSRVFRRF
jgi:serine/threonine protein kinase